MKTLLIIALALALSGCAGAPNAPTRVQAFALSGSPIVSVETAPGSFWNWGTPEIQIDWRADDHATSGTAHVVPSQDFSKTTLAAISAIGGLVAGLIAAGGL